MKRSATLLAAGFLLLVPAVPTRAGVIEEPDSNGSIQFKVGWFFPSGDSDLWRINESAFTQDHSDFNDGVIGFTYVAPMSTHVEIGFNVDLYESTVRSAYRGFTDQFGDLILHDATLSRVPATVDVRILPAGRYAVRGKRGQHLVRRPVPYVGAGAGFTFWEYEEVGDFLDTTDTIFFDRLKDTGTTFETHVLAGIELPLNPFWSVLFEGKYSWSKDTPAGSFAGMGLGDLDLGGFTGFLGAALHF